MTRWPAAASAERITAWLRGGAGEHDKTNAQMGLIANIVVGVVGSLLGHWGAGALGIAAAGTLATWIISLVGAVVLIAILRAVGVFS